MPRKLSVRTRFGRLSVARGAVAQITAGLRRRNKANTAIATGTRTRVLWHPHLMVTSPSTVECHYCRRASVDTLVILDESYALCERHVPGAAREADGVADGRGGHILNCATWAGMPDADVEEVAN